MRMHHSPLKRHFNSLYILHLLDIQVIAPYGRSLIKRYTDYRSMKTAAENIHPQCNRLKHRLIPPFRGAKGMSLP